MNMRKKKVARFEPLFKLVDLNVFYLCLKWPYCLGTNKIIKLIISYFIYLHTISEHH